LKKAGDAYTGLLYVTELWKLYVSIAVATDGADAAGEPSGVRSRPEENPLGKRLLDFEGDNALLALTQAGLDGDAPAMAAALPAARKAYELHIAGLDRWIASLNRGAFLSKKVIQVADIAMIAISLHQVAKMPVVPAGGSPKPPTILGTLPGGAAVGSVVSLPSLARAVEAIRKLVASGALDGALIGGIGSLGGGPSIALPELQRPTSLSVQGPGKEALVRSFPGDLLKNPKSIWGKDANEIAREFEKAGYKVMVEPSTKGSMRSTQVRVEGHPEITNIEIHPGGGRHGGAYYKISTSTQGKIKVVDPKTYIPSPGDKAKVIPYP
jgi:hypothetical protein